LYIVDHVAPGTTITRRIEVSNDTDEPEEVDLYAASATVGNEGFVFGDDRSANELTSWTTVDPSHLSLAPRVKSLARVEIKVPADASESERYGVVWASVAAPAPEGGGVGAVNRVGVRMYLSVGPGGEPASDFEITGIQARRTADGKPQVAARVKNTGGRALDLSGTLRLDGGPGGLSAGPFNAELGTTLGIGRTEAVLVDLNKALPAGPWTANITLQSGLLERSAKAKITFPKSGNATMQRPEKGGKLGLIGVLFFVAILALVILLFVLRRRRDADDA
jgi:hypothetical protein